MSYHLRSPLAKALFEKIQHQNEHSNATHREWYSARLKLLSNVVSERFLEMDQDKETKQFIEDCFTKSDWFFTQIYHGLAKSILTWFISATSANGLLNRGSMFVLSRSQIEQLLGLDEETKLERLLDLGAGDGNITIKFQPFFNQLLATEMSTAMQWRLRQKEIELLDVASWSDYPDYFDVISCLNLLDRCDRPLTLLSDIKRRLRPSTGILLLAVVFPVRQYVESKRSHQFGMPVDISVLDNSDHSPIEVMPLTSTRIWEVQFDHFVRDVIEPAGYQLVRWTRLPYLCEGDFSQSFYVLNDIILVLKPL